MDEPTKTPLVHSIVQDEFVIDVPLREYEPRYLLNTNHQRYLEKLLAMHGDTLTSLNLIPTQDIYDLLTERNEILHADRRKFIYLDEFDIQPITKTHIDKSGSYGFGKKATSGYLDEWHCRDHSEDLPPNARKPLTDKQYTDRYYARKAQRLARKRSRQCS